MQPQVQEGEPETLVPMTAEQELPSEAEPITVTEPEPAQEPVSDILDIPEPITDLPPEPEAEVQTEQMQPEVSEQELQEPQELQQSKDTTVEEPKQAINQPLMTKCPLCQQDIQEHINPCPHCGGKLDWGDGY